MLFILNGTSMILLTLMIFILKIHRQLRMFNLLRVPAVILHYFKANYNKIMKNMYPRLKPGTSTLSILGIPQQLWNI